MEDYSGCFIDDLVECSIKYKFLIMEDRKFVDISYIVNKQYAKFCNWIDLVTVHGSVTDETISKLSGVLLVANMSNNNYNLTDKCVESAKNNPKNIVGFITQYRIKREDLPNDFVCMTPGISNKKGQVADQKYKTANEVDTDYIIIGRAIYNSENIEEDIKQYLCIEVNPETPENN